MPLPENFSEFEHLQDTIRRDHNKAVKQYFKNQNDDDISTPKSSLKHACLIKDDDTATMTMMRMWLFEITIRHAQSIQPVIYGIPTTEFHETKEFFPQVVLWFREKTSEAKTHERYPARARVSFRIMDTNFTEAKAKLLALEIKQVMATPKLLFKKGEVKISYRDLANGYEFILAAYNETEAKELITKVLSLKNDKPNWEYLTNSESGRNWRTKKYKTILGKQQEMPNCRPIANVYFSHAELKIHGLTKDKILVDASGRFAQAYQFA